MRFPIPNMVKPILKWKKAICAIKGSTKSDKWKELLITPFALKKQTNKRNRQLTIGWPIQSERTPCDRWSRWRQGAMGEKVNQTVNHINIRKTKNEMIIVPFSNWKHNRADAPTRHRSSMHCFKQSPSNRRVDGGDRRGCTQRFIWCWTNYHIIVFNDQFIKPLLQPFFISIKSDRPIFR